jgi:hypothetical protein
VLLPIEFHQAVLVTIPFAFTDSSALIMLFLTLGKSNLELGPVFMIRGLDDSARAAILTCSAFENGIELLLSLFDS